MKFKISRIMTALLCAGAIAIPRVTHAQDGAGTANVTALASDEGGSLSDGASLTIAGDVSGASDNLNLSRINTFSGDTFVVSGGTFVVSGSIISGAQILGSGAMTNTGSGTLTINNDSGYSGGTIASILAEQGGAGVVNSSTDAILLSGSNLVLSGSGLVLNLGNLGSTYLLSGSGFLINSGSLGAGFVINLGYLGSSSLLSGSGILVLSGSCLPLPFTWNTVVAGSGNIIPPIITGSGGPLPPPWAGGTGLLPKGSVESLTIDVGFTAASGTTTSAKGVLEATSINGTDRGSLDVRTTGLEAGIYTVSAVTESSTTPVTLGTFDVRAPRTSGSAPAPMAPRRVTTNSRFGGPRGIPFPNGVDPFDLSSLAISDSNANVLFTADLTTATNGAFSASTPIVSGSGVTAIGSAQIHALARDGVVNGTLTVKARGLPANTTYTYAIDGADTGTVTTGSRGSLRLVATEKPAGGTLPPTVNLFTVTSVAVLDGSGNVILSGSF